MTIRDVASWMGELVSDLVVANARVCELKAEIERLHEAVLHYRRQLALAKQRCPTTEACACAWRDGLMSAIDCEAKLRAIVGRPEKWRKYSFHSTPVEFMDAGDCADELDAILNPEKGDGA